MPLSYVWLGMPTQNKMLGYMANLLENMARMNTEGTTDEKVELHERKHKDNFSIDQVQLNMILSLPLIHLFNEEIQLHSRMSTLGVTRWYS